MKITTLVFLCVFSSTCGFSQITDPNAVKREVKNFHAINVNHKFDVYLTQSDEESLAVSAGDKKMVDQVKSEVREGVLYIWHDGGNIHHSNTGKMNLKVYISFTQLDDLKVANGCHVYAEGEWKDKKLKKKLGL